MAGLVADRLDRVAMALGEEPQVARNVVVHLRLTGRVEHDRLAAAGDDVGPLGRDGVPMQLPRATWIEEHVDAGEAGHYRELVLRRLLGPSAGGHLRLRPVQRANEFGHRRDVLRIVVGHGRAGCQLVRVAAEATLAGLAVVGRLRRVRVAQRDQPAHAKRGGAEEKAPAIVHDTDPSLVKTVRLPWRASCTGPRRSAAGRRAKRLRLSRRARPSRCRARCRRRPSVAAGSARPARQGS